MTTNLMLGLCFIIYCGCCMCKDCHIIVSRPIDDEEASDSDGEDVEDGTVLSDEESDFD